MAATEAPPPSGTSPTGPLQGLLLELVGTLVAPSAALAGLAFYFGWVRTSSLLGFFGVSRELAGFTTQDYLTRSLEGLFVPLGGVGAAAALALAAHAVASELMLRRRGLRSLAAVAFLCSVVGAVLAVLGLTALISSRRLLGLSPLTLAMSLLLGVALGAGGQQIRRELAQRGSRPAAPVARSMRLLRGATIGFLLALGLFWATTQYAADIGRARARVVLSSIQTSPDSVTIYTDAPLHITMEGIEEDILGGAGGVPTYRYRGFKPLIINSTRYLLTSPAWTPARGQIAVLDPADVRYLEYVRDG